MGYRSDSIAISRDMGPLRLRRRKEILVPIGKFALSLCAWPSFGERSRGNTMRGNRTESLWERKTPRGTLIAKTKSQKGTSRRFSEVLSETLWEKNFPRGDSRFCDSISVTEGHPAEPRAPKLAPQNFFLIDFKPWNLTTPPSWNAIVSCWLASSIVLQTVFILVLLNKKRTNSSQLSFQEFEQRMKKGCPDVWHVRRARRLGDETTFSSTPSWVAPQSACHKKRPKMRPQDARHRTRQDARPKTRPKARPKARPKIRHLQKISAPQSAPQNDWCFYRSVWAFGAHFGPLLGENFWGTACGTLILHGLQPGTQCRSKRLFCACALSSAAQHMHVQVRRNNGLLERLAPTYPTLQSNTNRNLAICDYTRKDTTEPHTRDTTRASPPLTGEIRNQGVGKHHLTTISESYDGLPWHWRLAHCRNCVSALEPGHTFWGLQDIFSRYQSTSLSTLPGRAIFLVTTSRRLLFVNAWLMPQQKGGCTILKRRDRQSGHGRTHVAVKFGPPHPPQNIDSVDFSFLCIFQRRSGKIILTTPHPPYLQKICPQNTTCNGGLYGIKGGSSQGISTENMTYGPQNMAYEPYEPFLLGVGVVFNVLRAGQHFFGLLAPQQSLVDLGWWGAGVRNWQWT